MSYLKKTWLQAVAWKKLLTSAESQSFFERTDHLVTPQEKDNKLSLSGQQEVLNDTVDSENLADFVGSRIAYTAYAALPEQDKRVKLAGFDKSSEQLFFISLCSTWCSWYEKANERYAPDRSRCIVPLSNMPEFARAFSCAAGTVMNPDKKCTFW
ncbi:hypothetical protein HPB51_004823 [Rhipicephalus microplus]|uniref:Peptidase M13 C-terminal domain-containing protein n=1 Tax=Rhipicephalus microplus TaxID=6941 RepID=A0A9J6EWT0_RHIMP|nr:hypothetical protein HPB51_004823 [Rhipicephalus microplus]